MRIEITYVFFEVNSGALKKTSHQLVRIPSKRFWPFNPIQLSPMFPGQETSSTPCCLFGKMASWSVVGIGKDLSEERKKSKFRGKENWRKSNYSFTNWWTVWNHSYTFDPLRRFQSQLDHLYLLPHTHSIPSLSHSVSSLTLSSLSYSPLRQKVSPTVDLKLEQSERWREECVIRGNFISNKLK